MRINIVNNGGSSSGGFNISGATLTGPLILAGDPTAALEAATKQYVDNSVISLNAGHISTGTLGVPRLPAFTGGSVTSVVGSNVLTLNNTGVVAGTYTKVTVDGTGRVTAGASLLLTDIPSLSWNKITTGKPTTLAGYGITDGVKNTTDTVTGFIAAHAAPTANTHAATKGYVDSLIGTSSGLSSGDTVRRTSTTTPAGFLRCNGGEVSKTVYPALYAVVGDQYNYRNWTMPAAGQAWRQQYDFNTTQSGNIGAWTKTFNLPFAGSDVKVIVTKGWIYTLANANDANCWRASIAADGTISEFALSSVTMPTKHRAAEVVVIKNRVYLIGGSPSTYTNAVSMATIAADGTLSSFTSYNTLVKAVSNACAVVTKSYVYIIGGENNDSQGAHLQYAAINADGSLGAWNYQTLNLGFIYAAAAVVIRNRVYVIGGYTLNYSHGISYCEINSDGTLSNTWTSGNIAISGLYEPRVVSTKNRVYVIGGRIGADATYKYVISSAIAADGSLTGWGFDSGTFPVPIDGGDVFVTSSRIYYIGGVYYSEQDLTYYQSTAAYHASFTGGLNDYSAYHEGTITAANGTTFYLPDTTKTDPTNVYTFIKT